MNPADYPPLNLPPAPLRIQPPAEGSKAKVFDPQRRRWVTLTPEEWVRQHFVAMLTTVKGYFRGSIANEIGIRLNDTMRSSDTVVYDGSMRPLMIVEYKAPSVEITQDVFDQIVRYNMVLRARYLVVSNGLHHYCCEINYEAGNYRFLPDVPTMKSTQARETL